MDLARRGQEIVLVIAGMLSLTAEIRAEPPVSGTIFIDPDIIMSSDPTTFDGATHTLPTLTHWLCSRAYSQKIQKWGQLPPKECPLV